MKSYVIASGFFLFSNFAFANGFVCQVQKSLMKYNKETGETEVRSAISPRFQVTSAAHDDPRTFDFTDASGNPWGSVQVMTGSHGAGAEKWSYANAMVTNGDGKIIGYLNLQLPFSSTTSSASSLIFDDLEKMEPSLTISCSRTT